jgi:hypothetical protein
MFGWSVRTLQAGATLVIVDPISLSALLWASLFTIGPLIYVLAQRPLVLRRIAWIASLALVVFGFVLDGARVTLDRTTGLAHIERFALFHWSSMALPLTGISRAYLSTGSTTSRITLQMQDGSTFSLSGNNQMGGKPEAVLAINRYIGSTNAQIDR